LELHVLYIMALILRLETHLTMSGKRGVYGQRSTSVQTRRECRWAACFVRFSKLQAINTHSVPQYWGHIWPFASSACEGFPFDG
jgi:hypothetical protein